MKCLLIAIVTIVIVSQCAGYKLYDDYDEDYKNKESSYEIPQYSKSESQQAQHPNQHNTYEQKSYVHHQSYITHPEKKQSNFYDEYEDEAEEQIGPRPYYDLKDASRFFEDFKKKFHRQYKDAQEERLRFEYFKGNLKEINDLNAEGGTAVFDINLHADKKPSSW